MRQQIGALSPNLATLDISRIIMLYPYEDAMQTLLSRVTGLCGCGLCQVFVLLWREQLRLAS